MALNVHVITRPVVTLDEDIPSNHHVIDYQKHSSRVWLSKHCYWAFHNGFQVTTFPTDEPASFHPKLKAHDTKKFGDEVEKTSDSE